MANDHSKQVQRFDPGQMAAYQMGQQLASQLLDSQSTGNQASMRGMRVTQRQAHTVNGELYVTETEVEIVEEQGGSRWGGQPSAPRRSWIEILFGLN